MNKKELRAAVVFAILMEGHSGIVGKSPGYILEKLESTKGYDKPECLLDLENLAKFKAWKETWKVNFDSEDN
jgi:hypothetical protein